MSSPIDRRTFLGGLVGATGVVVLGGCNNSDEAGPAPTERPTVRLAGGAFGFPSPFAYAAGIGYYQMSLLYDTLLWKDASGQLQPWLAASVEPSPDAMSYTFVLREGITWSDGEPFTADDVVFTFDYFAKLTLPPLVVAQPRGVAKTVATDQLTVQFDLERPDVTFPEFVAGAVPIAPRHVWEGVEDPAGAFDPELLVTTGAYRLDSYEGPDQGLAYTARDDYFLGQPFVERIEMTPVGDELAALQAGELDAGGHLTLGGVRPDALEAFSSDPSFEIIQQTGTFTYPLYFNLTKGGALADVRFRQAVATAIDRADITDRLTGGTGQPGNPGFLPPDHPFHVPVEQYAFDVDAANAMLEDAGYPLPQGSRVRQGPDGEPLSFQLLFAEPNTPVAELVTQALGAIGVEATPRPAPLGPQLFGPKLSGEFDLAVLPYPGPGGPTPNSDPDILRQVYSAQMPPTPTNAVGYQNPDFEQLAQQQLATLSPAERQEPVAKMQHIVAEDLPLLPLYYSTTVFVFRPDVFDGWYFTPGDFPVTVINRQAFIEG